MSMTYHPQSDGQTGAVNKVIAMYLRCLMRSSKIVALMAPLGRVLLQHILLIRSQGDALCVVYGCDPPALHSYKHGDSRVPTVDQAIQDCDKIWLTSANAYSKHRNMLRTIMVSITLKFTTKLAIGFGFILHIVKHYHYLFKHDISLVCDSLGRIKSWSALAKWHTACSNRVEHTSIMCFTLPTQTISWCATINAINTFGVR